MSFPGGGRPSGVGFVEVAILMTASTWSLVGMTVDVDSLTAEETKEEAAVLGLP